MGNSDKLSALGVKDDDLLMMMVSNTSSGYVGFTSCFSVFEILEIDVCEYDPFFVSFAYFFSGAAPAAGSDLGMNPDGSASNPAAFQQHLRGDSNLMGQLFQV